MVTDNFEIADLGSDAKSAREPLTREDLYALVWSEPMLKVAARYGVSSSYMARVCTRLNVPRPQRGYWAKLAVGKAPQARPLPEARPGDELIWCREGDALPTIRPKLKPLARVGRKHSISGAKREQEHPLIKGAKALFETGRLSYDVGYLKPAKRLLVDLGVTKTGLDKALTFANKLFLSLEESGHRVVIAPHGEQLRREAVDEREKPGRNRGYTDLWSPGRCTVVYIGTVAIGLAIVEMSEEVEARYVDGKYIREVDYVPPKRVRYAVGYSWTTKKDFPTGRLCLQAYSPYFRAKWVRQWRETTDLDLSSRIPRIVRELEGAAVDVARLVEEGERQAELERERREAQYAQWRKEEEERRTAKAIKESKEELIQIINGWVESERIEQFFMDVERRAAELDTDVRQVVLDRLKYARELFSRGNSVERLKSWKLPGER